MSKTLEELEAEHVAAKLEEFSTLYRERGAVHAYRDVAASITMPHWGDALVELPGHMVDGVVLYVLVGGHVGSFLDAVLCGDLFRAMGAADEINLGSLPRYGRFFHNAAPGACFGSPEKVRAWVAGRGLAGLLGRARAAQVFKNQQKEG